MKREWSVRTHTATTPTPMTCSKETIYVVILVIKRLNLNNLEPFSPSIRVDYLMRWKNTTKSLCDFLHNLNLIPSPDNPGLRTISHISDICTWLNRIQFRSFTWLSALSVDHPHFGATHSHSIGVWLPTMNFNFLWLFSGLTVKVSHIINPSSRALGH